jgi:hypothetical protein
MDAKTIAALLSSLATAPLLVGCAKPQTSEVPSELPPTSRTFSIAPGEFVEVNFEMTAGSTVVVAFSEGSDDIAWDVHSHGPSGETNVHDSGRGGAGNVEFKAPTTGVFSVLWKNAGSTSTPLEVRVTLDEGSSIHSWMPAP